MRVEEGLHWCGEDREKLRGGLYSEHRASGKPQQQERERERWVGDTRGERGLPGAPLHRAQGGVVKKLHGMGGAPDGTGLEQVREEMGAGGGGDKWGNGRGGSDDI